VRQSTTIASDQVEQRSGPRHSTGKQRPRPSRRRRWFVVAAALVVLTALAAPTPGSQGLTAVGHVDDATLPRSLTTTLALPVLSTGAPAGAATLASAPERVAEPEPATPAVITGLAANGIPNVALNAYRVAAARMGTVMPSCGIDWSLLAGIGRVESNHGRFAGAVLNPDGTSTPQIRGPALNGVQFAYIRDSDNGVWDGDAAYDRAVGPMQFIPTTWRAYAIDADGTGTPDPFNINDAALAAAHYLCVAGGDLRTAAGQRRAILAYNHSDSYVAEVLALARAYAAGIPVADIPIMGNTSGPVPPPTGFYGAPAAPGPAIGAKDTTPASGDTTGAAPPAGPAGSSGPPPQAAASGGQPAGGPGGSGSPPTSGPATGAGSGSESAPAPAPEPPAPAPLPSVPLPLPVPPPPPALPVPPPPPVPVPLPQLVPGVSCGGILQPVCPR
jgi:membrane-bound lytic murein transglycosylase B